MENFEFNFWNEDKFDYMRNMGCLNNLLGAQIASNNEQRQVSLHRDHNGYSKDRLLANKFGTPSTQYTRIEHLAELQISTGSSDHHSITDEMSEFLSPGLQLTSQRHASVPNPTSKPLQAKEVIVKKCEDIQDKFLKDNRCSSMTNQSSSTQLAPSPVTNSEKW